MYKYCHSCQGGLGVSANQLSIDHARNYRNGWWTIKHKNNSFHKKQLSASRLLLISTPFLFHFPFHRIFCILCHVHVTCALCFLQFNFTNNQFSSFPPPFCIIGTFVSKVWFILHFGFSSSQLLFKSTILSHGLTCFPRPAFSTSFSCSGTRSSPKTCAFWGWMG